MNTAFAEKISTSILKDEFDLSVDSIRDLNQALHSKELTDSIVDWKVSNPGGQHNIAVGIKAPVNVTIDGHAGYYCAGMNQEAHVIVNGNVGVGVAENMMSGSVYIKGNASQAAGATAHGGLLVIEGDAGARCGISMKGVDIVVGGSIGHMSCFMGQAGRLVVWVMWYYTLILSAISGFISAMPKQVRRIPKVRRWRERVCRWMNWVVAA